MEETLQAQIETYLSHLEGLIGRGQAVRDKLAADSSDPSVIAATRVWQEDCGVTISQLSGGSKAHWLARSFSQAFLMRSAAGDAVTGAAPAEIVQRLLGVLEQAVASLSGLDARKDSGVTDSSSATKEAPPHRFDFVHNAELRPVLEQAYLDSKRALEQSDYDVALRTSCGILEAIVTDALEHKGLSALAASGALRGKLAERELAERMIGEKMTAEKTIADWSFQTRLAIAEKAGLIRGGCARLPAVARTYRDHADATNVPNAEVSEREARVTGQVLHVIMRDLDPGR
ncbi:MAG: hypothetical protein WCF61_12395 [Terriglobales bacterium]